MRFHVTLAQFYGWSSDIKQTILDFYNLDEKEILEVVQKCYKDVHWNNIAFPHVSILIDPSNDEPFE